MSRGARLDPTVVPLSIIVSTFIGASVSIKIVKYALIENVFPQAVILRLGVECQGIIFGHAVPFNGNELRTNPSAHGVTALSTIAQRQART